MSCVRFSERMTFSAMNKDQLPTAHLIAVEEDTEESDAAMACLVFKMDRFYWVTVWQACELLGLMMWGRNPARKEG